MAISPKQLSQIKGIVQEFIQNNAFDESEEHIQTSYTRQILECLGWNSSLWKINKGQDIDTGKRPDILLKAAGGGTVFVIESKEAEKSLDGEYKGKWTFPEQLCFYIGAEGVSWGALTNFIEWRIYNAHAYETNKTPYRTLPIIDKQKKIICASDKELSEFFSLLRTDFLTQNRGKV
jgi:hypothetical protein